MLHYRDHVSIGKMFASKVHDRKSMHKTFILIIILSFCLYLNQNDLYNGVVQHFNSLIVRTTTFIVKVEVYEPQCEILD